MIDSSFDVSLGGVKYRIAEDVEETGYVMHAEPLRAPLGNVVLGDPGRFHLRPDLLEWSISSWDGGEGQSRFNGSPDTQNRYATGWNIDPFSLPGKLQLSPDWEFTQIVSAGGDLDEFVYFSDLGDDLVGVAQVDPAGAVKNVWVWDDTTETWSVLLNDSSAAGALRGAAGDANSLYYSDGTNIRRINAGSASQWSTSTSGTPMAVVGAYVYTGLDSAHDSVWEIPTTGTPPVTATEIYTIDEGTIGAPLMAAGSNRVWMVTRPTLDTTILHSITPTTAAAAGFGTEIFRQKGFAPHAVWVLFGIVYILGRLDDTPAIMYYDSVNETQGIIAELIDKDFPSGANDSTIATAAGGTNSPSGFIAKFLLRGGPTTGDEEEWTVMALNPVTGGVAGGTVFSYTAGTGTQLLSPAQLGLRRGMVFAAFHGLTGSTNEVSVLREKLGTFTDSTGIMHSSLYDFQLVDSKVLQTVQVSLEALPSGCTVVLKYRLNGSTGAWTTAGTISTAGTTKETFTFTGSTVEFNEIQFRLELSNGGTTSITPVVTGITARARVLKKVKKWDLILDATDEDGQAQHRSWNGETLLENIRTLGDGTDIVTFLDGYGSRDPANYSTHSVVVDDYRVIQQRPGEGQVMVRLVEVA